MATANLSLKLSTEMKHLSVRIAQASTIIIILTLIICYVAHISADNSLLFVLSIVAAMVPLSLMAETYVRFTPRTTQHIANAAACALASNAGELLTVLIGLIIFASSHIPTAITAAQILIIELFGLALPLVTLRWDDGKSSINFKQLTTLSAITGYIAFGLLAAAASYGNFLLFFVRHHLSARYLDPSLPLYHQATSLTCLTLLLCLYAYILLEREATHKKFFTSHLRSNRRLLLAFAASAFLLANVIYDPPLQFLFNTGSLGFVDVLLAISFTCLYTICRLIQRYTNKHSRRAVLKLYHDLKESKI